MSRRRVATTRVGAAAEEMARRFLESRGLTLVERNFRCRLGEIDLLMLDGRTLVIAEVRYRRQSHPVDPLVTITAAKRIRLLRTAALFLQCRPRFADGAIRFDVVAVSGPMQAPSVRWVRGAFTTDDDAGRWGARPPGAGAAPARDRL